MDRKQAPGPAASPSPSASPHLPREIADGHHLVTVGAAAARSYPAAEELAVRTSLLAQVAR
jgi:hypothetical protein